MNNDARPSEVLLKNIVIKNNILSATHGDNDVKYRISIENAQPGDMIYMINTYQVGDYTSPFTKDFLKRVFFVNSRSDCHNSVGVYMDANDIELLEWFAQDYQYVVLMPI